MRLRNRIIKATFYTDPELCRWPIAKREFYRSLWACAEDSCCLEDDMFGVKLAAWPSPLDSEMSVESFEAWRDELVDAGKLIPYTENGKRYLYIPTMAEHEKPRNPQPPDSPIPPWVCWQPHGSDARKGRYEHSYDCCTSVVQASPPRPVLSRTKDTLSDKSDTRQSDFDAFYDAYPRHEKPGDAEKAWKALRPKPPLSVLLDGIERYKRSEKYLAGYVMLPATWLRSKSWLDEYTTSDPVSTVKFGVL